jgi:precorrin-2/cobalt-factor-2 C20-methyltransferase
MTDVPGSLFGLGVGPGDPELITLKAQRILKSVPVIAYPAPEEGESLARAIAAPHIFEKQIEIVIRTPMTPGNFPANDVYDYYSKKIEEHLNVGRDVAVICEGDPFLYGSFMYLYERLSNNYRAEVVPGVSSLGAVAAVAGRPLVSRNQVLSLLPAPMEEKKLEYNLSKTDAAAIMKIGRHLKKVKNILARLGLNSDATYVEHASMPNQKILPLNEVTDDFAPYFSMILVNPGQRGEV